MRRREGHLLFALFVAVAVGIVEESQFVFQPEDAADRAVDLLFGDLALPHQLFERTRIAVALHVDVALVLHGQQCGLFLVLGDAVGNHLGHGTPVGDDDAVPTPLAAQDLLHEESVAGRRNAREFVERVHESRGTRVSGGFERRQVEFAQPLVGDVHRIVVAAALGGSVAREMLRTGEDGVRRREVIALKSPDTGPGDVRPEVGVLPRSLHDAAPAGIACDVDHRGESPLQTRCRGFDGGHPGRGFDGRHVPRTALGQRHGRNGLVAVDHVQREDQGNAQPGLLDGDPLEFPRRGGSRDVEHGSDLSFADAPFE